MKYAKGENVEKKAKRRFIKKKGCPIKITKTRISVSMSVCVDVYVYVCVCVCVCMRVCVRCVRVYKLQQEERKGGSDGAQSDQLIS